MKNSKTIYLVRHAKSSWEDPSLSDRARPLNSRGKENLPLMAQRLAENIFQYDDHFPRPQAMISSPAVRAHTTAKGFARELYIPASEIKLDERLYFKGSNAILQLIREQDDSSDAIALVSHNPNLTHLYNQLCPIEIDHMPTCSVATLVFNIEHWNKLSTASGQLVDFDFPNKEIETIRPKE